MNQSGDDAMNEKSSLRRWLSFSLATALTWVVCFVAAPALVECSPAMTRMAKFIDNSGIETGEFYYTDVEACSTANLNTQNTVDYMPHGPVLPQGTE